MISTYEYVVRGSLDAVVSALEAQFADSGLTATSSSHSADGFRATYRSAAFPDVVEVTRPETVLERMRRGVAAHGGDPSALGPSTVVERRSVSVHKTVSVSISAKNASHVEVSSRVETYVNGKPRPNASDEGEINAAIKEFLDDAFPSGGN